jgi:hypothetical protein
MRGYFIHLAMNWKAAREGLVMFFFHFIHGIIPVKATEHEFWGIGGIDKAEEE